MKLLWIPIQFSVIVLSILPLLLAAHTFRDPFQFATEDKTETSIKSPEVTVDLSKWNIKDVGNNLIIIEDVHDGQMRTIEITSF